MHVLSMGSNMLTILFLCLVVLKTAFSGCPTDMIPGTATTSYKSNNNNCYYFSTRLRNDVRATTECFYASGLLTSILSASENEFIRKVFDNVLHIRNKLVLIGLTYDNEKLKWDDGSPVGYTNFQTTVDELKYTHNDKYACIGINTTSGYWQEYQCLYQDEHYKNYLYKSPKLPFVCKVKAT